MVKKKPLIHAAAHLVVLLALQLATTLIRRRVSQKMTSSCWSARMREGEAVPFTPNLTRTPFPISCELADGFSFL